MDAIDIARAVFSTGVDTQGLETGLREAERMVEDSTSNIAGMFTKLGPSIAIGIGLAVVTAIHHAVVETAQWAIEMETLGNRMGVTAKEASQLVGVMKSVGMSTESGVMAMTRLAYGIQETGRAMDPFNTRLGRMFGYLRDANGQLMTTAQVLDLARKKVGETSDAMERLKIAQAISPRDAGKLLDMLSLSNEQFKKMKDQAVAVTEEAEQMAHKYQETINAIRTSWQQLVTDVAMGAYEINKSAYGQMNQVEKQLALAKSPYAKLAKAPWKPEDVASFRDVARQQRESTGIKVEGEEDRAWKNLPGDQKEVLTAQTLANASKVAQELKSAYSLGVASIGDWARAASLEIHALDRRRQLLEEQKSQITGTDPQSVNDRLEKEAQINALVERRAKIVQESSAQWFEDQKLKLAATGAYEIENEIKLQELRLQGEKMGLPERLKIEADIFQKRKQYTEQLVDIGRKLGFVSISQEIDYRKQAAKDSFALGNTKEGVGELLKLRDLQVQQQDQLFQAAKLVRIVSMAEEVDFAKRKLELVKGTAEAELKALTELAAKDKALYDARNQYAQEYFQKQIAGAKALESASGAGEQLTAGQTRRGGRASESSIQDELFKLRDIRSGGTEEQHAAATTRAQQVVKDAELRVQQGTADTAFERQQLREYQEYLRERTGLDQRAPGAPSPVIDSALRSGAAPATVNLLDTTTSGMMIRFQDVIGSVNKGLTDFGIALEASTKKVAGTSGTAGIFFPPGNNQPQSQPLLPVGPNSLAQPRSDSGRVPGQTAEDTNVIDIRRLTTAFEGLPDKISSVLATNNEKSLALIRQAVADERAAGGASAGEIVISVDEAGFHAEFVKKAVKAVTEELKQ